MKNTLAILTAGTLWGTMGIFVRVLTGFGLSSLQISAVRLFSASLILIIISAFSGGSENYKIKRRDILWFLMNGIFSITGLTICYFNSIKMSSLCTAAILLYTAPVFVMIMSYFIFREKITPMKLMALVCALLGCAFVTGFGGKISAAGVAWGIGSGICYALYSIFGTILLKKYKTFQVTLISFIAAAIAILPFSDIGGIAAAFENAENKPLFALLCVLIGLVTAVLPYMLFTYGLNGTIPGKASIMASVEPVVATVIGILFFSEPFGANSFIGVILVILAVMLVNNFGKSVDKKDI